MTSDLDIKVRNELCDEHAPCPWCGHGAMLRWSCGPSGRGVLHEWVCRAKCVICGATRPGGEVHLLCGGEPTPGSHPNVEAEAWAHWDGAWWVGHGHDRALVEARAERDQWKGRAERAEERLGRIAGLVCGVTEGHA